jgi:hypothetical protein
LSRTRVLPVLAALAAAAFALTGLVLIGAPAGAVTDHPATKLPPKPKVGQCRNLTPAQAAPSANNSPTTPCSEPHTTYTFAVANVAKRVNLKHISAAKFQKAGLDVCNPRFNKLLGRTYLVRDQSAFTYIFFGPTKAQRAAGARWIRCDLAVDGVSGFLDLPPVHRPLLSGPLTNAERRCLTSQRNTVPCTEAHVLRSVGAFTVKKHKMPTIAQLTALGAKHCPSADYYSWPSKYRWSAGDHVEVCYRSTTT